MSEREYAYWIVDVFTGHRFGGNQLAVIPDALGLSDEQMQAIAREFNYSETTFVLPSLQATARMRIFTPLRELPFAGHPTVGTAWVLGQERQLGEAELQLEAGVGVLNVRLAGDTARFQVAIQPRFAPLDIPASTLAELLGLAQADLGADGPVLASCGLPFALVPLQNLAAVGKARLTRALDDPVFQRWPALAELYLYCFETVSPAADVHARMFAPGAGVAEDPATGSAASALAAWLAHTAPGDGRFETLIEQGLEMGRPSRIETTVEKSDGRLEVFVRGRVIPFSRGLLRV